MPTEVTPALVLLRQYPGLAGCDDATLHDMAGHCRLLDLEDHACLLTHGTPVQQVYLLESGQLRGTPAPQGGAGTADQWLHPGDVVDPFAACLGAVYTHTWRCETNTRLWAMPARVWRESLQRVPANWRFVLARARHDMLSEALRVALTRALPGCEAASLARLAFDEGRWWHMARGEPLFRANEPFDAWYVLVSGQLAEFDLPLATPPCFSKPDAILRPGDRVGDTAGLTGTPYSTSVFAMRDSWLMRLEPEEFNTLVLEQPPVVQLVARQAVGRRPHRKQGHAAPLRAATLAVVLGAHVPDGERLVQVLAQALDGCQPVTLLDAHTCQEWGIVPDVAHRLRADLEWVRLDTWLDQQHQQGRQVVLVADTHNRAWSEQVMRLADRALLLAEAQGPVGLSGAPLWPAQAPNPNVVPPAWVLQHWLCLVHPADTPLPQGTRLWLDALHPPKHFHVRRDHRADWGRLARHLSDQAIGLALSGGGARGPAHAGVYRALSQAGIPVDCVAGASAGALMACLLAQGDDWRVCAERAIAGIGPAPGPFSDITLPLVSVSKTQRLERSVYSTYRDAQLEDAWIPCLVITTNLTRMCKTVLSVGSMAQAALASISPPAVAKPQVVDGELLCDGGLVENLPVGVLLEQGCRYILASDIGSELNLRLAQPGFPNPWFMLFDRVFKKGRATAGVPTVVEILLAATTLASEGRRQAFNAQIDLCITPDLRRFKATDFTRSWELIEQGFADATAQISAHKQCQPSAPFWQTAPNRSPDTPADSSPPIPPSKPQP